MKRYFAVLLMALFCLFCSYVSAQKVLVAYFSCTGTTERVACVIAKSVGAELYTIVPTIPYTVYDLDWQNNDSRSSVEMHCDTLLPAMDKVLPQVDTYDVIFLGYPIWWDQAPRIIASFIEHCDLQGRVVIPFATSGSSTIGNSVTLLSQNYPQIKWQTGKTLNKGRLQTYFWAKSALRNAIKQEPLRRDD